MFGEVLETLNKQWILCHLTPERSKLDRQAHSSMGQRGEGKTARMHLGVPINESHKGAREATLAGAWAHRQEGPGMGDQGRLENDFIVNLTGFS